MMTYADLALDEEAHEVRRAGTLVALSPTEFNLLRYLMVNAGKVVSKTQILDRVWKLRLRRGQSDRRVLHQLPTPQDRSTRTHH
jgi:DNA-binding response OmpR family regulator